jgi:MFS family permease
MTDIQQALYKKYLAYQLLSNLWFISAVWVYFYRIFITDQKIGLLDGIAFAIGLVAEIPAGALADRLGRDKLTRLGQILIGIGLITQAFGSSFVVFVTGQSIMMVGMSFTSGADEALFFENLNLRRDSIEWRKLLTRGSQVALLGSLVATIIGGLLQHNYPRLPWILNGVCFAFSAMIIWSINDNRPKEVRQKLTQEIHNYAQNIHQGFSSFLTTELWLYVPIILTVQALFYASDVGLLRLILLSRFHFSAFAGALVIASCCLISVGALSLMHRHAKRLSEKKVIVTIAVSAGLSLVLSLFNVGYWGYLVILIIYIGEHTLAPFMSETLNYHAKENQRATLLSVASFLKTLPYVMLAPIIGALNTHHHLNYFLIIWALLIAAATCMYVVLKRKDARIVIE